MKHELLDGARVLAWSTIGLLSSWRLSDFSVLVSIGVGLATFAYICAKIFFLFKRHGRASGGDNDNE